MSDGYTDMHVHCVLRDGAVSFHGWIKGKTERLVGVQTV